MQLKKKKLKQKFIKRMLEEIEVYIPDELIKTKFNDICENNQRMIERLKRQIVIAREARDRLLPKLMNGEIVIKD